MGETPLLPAGLGWEGLTAHPGFEALLFLLSLCLVLLLLFHTALLENLLFYIRLETGVIFLLFIRVIIPNDSHARGE